MLDVLALGIFFAIAEAAHAQEQAPTTAPEARQRLIPRPVEVRPVEVDARAVVECTVQADRSVTNCRVVSENPPGFGFGTAALLAAQHFKMAAPKDGRASDVGSRVRIPLSWKSGG